MYELNGFSEILKVLESKCRSRVSIFHFSYSCRPSFKPTRFRIKKVPMKDILRIGSIKALLPETRKY